MVCYAAVNEWKILGREINSIVTLFPGFTVYRETESQTVSTQRHTDTYLETARLKGHPRDVNLNLSILWNVLKVQRKHRDKTSLTSRFES